MNSAKGISRRDFCRAVGGGIVVLVALEPAPANFASLVKNVALNGLSERVYVLPIGAGDSGSPLPASSLNSDSPALPPWPGASPTTAAA